MQKLAEQAINDFSLSGIAVYHRIGEVVIIKIYFLIYSYQKIGEASINIVGVSPHRREALQGVAWAIDELKMKVPIWKKEYYEDGEIGENI